MMDRQGIATAVTSISAPGVHFGDANAARELARRCNELSAKLVADHPTRFGAFAILPLPDVKGALLELEYALDVLKLDGVVLLTSHSDGRYLGDPLFDDVMAELDRRSAVAFVHPVVPKTSESIRLDVPGFAAEFVFDTTRAAINLIWSGAMERWPNLRIILSHAGGTTPYLAGRIRLLGAPAADARARAQGRRALSRRSSTTTRRSPRSRTRCARCRSSSDPRRSCSAATSRSRPSPSRARRSTGSRATTGSTRPRARRSSARTRSRSCRASAARVGASR